MEIKWWSRPVLDGIRVRFLGFSEFLPFFPKKNPVSQIVRISRFSLLSYLGIKLADSGSKKKSGTLCYLRAHGHTKTLPAVIWEGLVSVGGCQVAREAL